MGDVMGWLSAARRTAVSSLWVSSFGRGDRFLFAKQRYIGAGEFACA
jgi:hypothetical protein